MEGYPAKKPTWAQLEKVAYFQALIKEGLRYFSPMSLMAAPSLKTAD
jgi:hypothetical protein